MSSDESYLLNLSNTLGITTDNDERRRVQEQLSNIFRAHFERSLRTVLSSVITTPRETPQAYVMVSFLLDFLGNHGKELRLHQDAVVTGFITDSIVHHLTVVGLETIVDNFCDRGGGAERIQFPWNIRWARKLSTLLAVSTVLSLSASEAATIKIYNACIGDFATTGHLRATLLFSLHNLLKTYESRRICKSFKKASSIVAPSLAGFLQSSIESNRYDWAIMVLKIMIRVAPIDDGDDVCHTGMLLAVVKYLDVVRQRLIAGVQEGNERMCMLRSVKYGLKVLEKVIGNLSASIHPKSLNNNIICEILTTALHFIHHSPTERCFTRSVGIIETMVSFGGSSGACAAAINTAFPLIDNISQILLHTALHYLIEADIPVEQLLRKWDANAETYFDELELLSGSDSSESAAESLFTALTGFRSDECSDQLHFLQGGWQVIKQLLESPASIINIYTSACSGTVHSNTDAMTLTVTSAKVLAYRILGLGHYSMCDGQEENYRFLFNQFLIPDINNPNPLIQRRAIWAIGMWCETTDHTMRLSFFTEIGKMLCSGNVHLVIVLTALRAMEHFVNDNSFHYSDIPNGMLSMLMHGLETVVPSLQSPQVIQSIAGLIFVLLEKTSVVDHNNANATLGGTTGVGCGMMGIPNANTDPIFDMFAPTITKFIQSKCVSEEMPNSKNPALTNGCSDDGECSDEDKEGAMTSAMLIVLEVLGSACWRASDDKKWSVLLPLVSFLTNSYNCSIVGHQLGEEGWGVFVALVYTTVSLPSQQPSAPFEAFQFAVSQLDMDLEESVMVKCIRVVSGLYSLISAVQGGPHGQLLTEEIIWKLCQHCSKYITKVTSLLSCHDKEVKDSVLGYGLLDIVPAVVELAIVISFPIGNTSCGGEAVCEGAQTTNAIVQSTRQHLFESVSNFLLQPIDDSIIERCQLTPILVGLYASLAPVLISHRQDPSPSPPQLPGALARRLSIIIDVTTSSWAVRAIGVLCERLLVDCTCTADDRELLTGVIDTCITSLSNQMEMEDHGNNNNSNNGLILNPRLEALMEAFENGGLKMCAYTERLSRCGVIY